jgi:microcystin-dependent protein
MSSSFTGEVRIFAFDWAPRGWARCDGQLMPIAQNQALYSLLGSAYGGDGTTTFALPDLRDRVGVHHYDPAFPFAKRGGESAVSLSMAEMPREATHAHAVACTQANATSNFPSKAVLAGAGGVNVYQAGNPLQPINAGTIGKGGGAGHDNMSPYQVVGFCISLDGIYPSKD